MKTWIGLIVWIGLFAVAVESWAEGAIPTAEAEVALEKSARAYEEAFGKADADAIGALLAGDVAYTNDQGVLISGRDSVVVQMRKAFAMNPGATMAIRIESVRMLSPDVALERGVTRITSKDGEAASSAYTAIHVREGGNWKIKEIVETPVPIPSPEEMLSQLAWMVGTWQEKDGDADIRTTVNWAEGGNFLTRNFEVTVGDQVTLKGWQIIGWDAANQSIRSWLFDSEGAFQEGVWSRDGNRWSIRQSGTLPDGGTLSSESILSRINDAKCTWQSTNRTLDGDPLPNLPPVEMNKL